MAKKKTARTKSIKFLCDKGCNAKPKTAHMAPGHTRQEMVAGKAGTFEYSLACNNPRCQSSVDNPRMLVP